uniref:ATP synthase subunit a n=1 Tax=Trinorchestia longiramus TaxID=1923959 RepID=A0A385UL62_9CRUS|nr:ATP synthase F0 subunit 6 [Trinorchestia longiramus]AYB71593.1 ATP synthase F0 subunit 6 [Trinorchestia longiramus]
MTNLFSMFDPATSSWFSLNWTASLLFMLIFPIKKWLVPTRWTLTMSLMSDYIFNQFMPMVKKMKYLLITTLSYMLFIMFNNVMGLFPYIFTSSSHMSFTLPLALTSWLAMMIYGWLNNYTNLLTHLIPQGTPYILMPFMVLIETISNLIRPGTLAVRLTANMIAGHLLMVLLSTALSNAPTSAVFALFTALSALTILETAVSFIQAYVFSVLITLYMAEFAD